MSKYLALLALPVPLKKLSAISVGFLPVAAIGQRLDHQRGEPLEGCVEQQSAVYVWK